MPAAQPAVVNVQYTGDSPMLSLIPEYIGKTNQGQQGN